MTKKKSKKARALAAISRLEKLFPAAKCGLNYKNEFELLVAVQLSAQCTDARVNAIAPKLFSRVKNWRDLAEIPEIELQKLIFSTGFYRQKARNLQKAARQILEKFDGKLPRKMADLTKLSGVGRKTANVLLQTLFGVVEGIVVDTHVARISRKLGLTREKDPIKIERDLMKIIPKTKWAAVGNLFVFYGRNVEPARKKGIFPLSDLYV